MVNKIKARGIFLMNNTSIYLQNVWEVFNFKTFEDFQDDYFKNMYYY